MKSVLQAHDTQANFNTVNKNGQVNEVRAQEIRGLETSLKC